MSTVRWFPVQGSRLRVSPTRFGLGSLDVGTAQKAVWPGHNSWTDAGIGGSNAPWLGTVHPSTISTSQGRIEYIVWSIAECGQTAFPSFYHMSSTLVPGRPLTSPQWYGDVSPCFTADSRTLSTVRCEKIDHQVVEH